MTASGGSSSSTMNTKTGFPKTGAKPIYVLDCGGQYCHLIASRIRRHEALAIVAPNDTPATVLQKEAGAVIVSGGPQSVFDAEAIQVDPAVWSLRDVPVLGICYGCQLMCRDLGGEVSQGDRGEYGPALLETFDPTPLLPLEEEAEQQQNSDNEKRQKLRTVWMSHRDSVSALPPNCRTVAKTADCPHAVVKVTDRDCYGVQFHPEVNHTEGGFELLGRFVDLAGLRGTWRATDFVEKQLETIRRRVLNDDDDDSEENSTKKKTSVFVLVSGGVDSTVTYALIAKALPEDRVRGLYVDTGMMRLNETETVKRSLAEAGLGKNLRYVDASQRFLTALDGVTAPEAKRRIIGREFLAVQRDACAELLHGSETRWLLGQGTIYPDTIESGGGSSSSSGSGVVAKKMNKADVIKTHHNRVPEIDALIARGLVLEPVADLYKDEVRAVGERLGLPKKMVWRQPFPGPGLGVRLLCVSLEDASNDDETERSQWADAIRRDFLSSDDSSYIARVDVPPLRSVGCQGDSRTYRHFAVLSDLKPPLRNDWTRIDALATNIVNASEDINRVVISLFGSAGDDDNKWCLSPGAPHCCTKSRFDVLRRADALVAEKLIEHGLMHSIWQCPVAMAPLTTSGMLTKKEVIILRPVDSTEAMTASFSKLPFDFLYQLARDIVQDQPNDIAGVFFDVTNKPPGTIEWE